MRPIAPFGPSFMLPLALALSACSQPDTPQSRIAEERHENFETIGDAFKNVNDELKRSAPDVAKLRVSSATIAGLAPKVESWFPKGSGPQDGVKSDALDTVWTDPGEFRRVAQRFTAAATNFDALAKAGDVAGMRDAAKALGGACKACHDRFREKD